MESEEHVLRQRRVDQLRDAILMSVREGDDFGDVLSAALTAAAEELGSVAALVAGRPGSWEAEDVRHLAGGANVPDSLMGSWR